MPKIVSIAAARARLTRIVQEAFLERKRTLIGKHGVPMAALLSIAEYEELLEDLEDLRDMHQAEQEDRRTSGKDFEAVANGLRARR